MALIITPGQLTQRADFYFQLQSLVTAGMPIIQALETVASGAAARGYGPRIRSVIQRLQQGLTLGEAMRAEEKWLPEFDLALISAGEHSGRLDAVLKHLGSFYKERAELARRVLSDLAYPVFIIHLCILVFPTGYLRLLVWEGRVGLFLTQKLLILIPLYALILAGVVAGQGTRSGGWRAKVEAFLNRIPVLGKARRELAVARFSAALGALLSAGVQVIQAWEMAARASGSLAIEKAVAGMTPQVEAGATPAEVLRRSSLFPEVFKNLYASGEVSGQLDSSLERLHQYYQEQATLKFQNLGQWVPRILLLTLAIVIGYTVVTFYIGYFGQITEIPF